MQKRTMMAVVYSVELMKKKTDYMYWLYFMFTTLFDKAIKGV